MENAGLDQLTLDRAKAIQSGTRTEAHTQHQARWIPETLESSPSRKAEVFNYMAADQQASVLMYTDGLQ